MGWKPEYDRAPSRGRALSRVLRLLRFLSQTDREWSMRELGDRFGVDSRTIFRDVCALKATNWPIRISKGGRILAKVRLLK